MNNEYYYLMYPTVVLIGMSQSIMLGTSVNMINEMIGLKAKKSAIVFGTYSFFDKIANGIIIYLAMVIFLSFLILIMKIELIIICRLRCILHEDHPRNNPRNSWRPSLALGHVY